MTQARGWDLACKLLQKESLAHPVQRMLGRPDRPAHFFDFASVFLTSTMPSNAPTFLAEAIVRAA
jgi:hypothetical protein